MRTPFRMIGVSLLSVAALLATAGCSVLGIAPAKSESERVILALAEEAPAPLWEVEVTTAGTGPKLAGDVLVSYIIDNDDLFLAGFSAATGEELWRHPASTSGQGPTVALSPALIENEAGEVRALNALDPEFEALADGSQQGSHPLELIDVKTGVTTVNVNPGWLQLNGSDGSGNCVISHAACIGTDLSAKTGGVVAVTFDGEVVLNPYSAVLPGWGRTRSLDGETGIVLGARGEQGMVARIVDGAVLWESTLNELGFDGKVPFEDGTNNMNELQVRLDSRWIDEGVIILAGGMMEIPWDTDLPYSPTIAAVDAETGTLLWSKAGTICAGVFCEGETTWRADSTTRWPADSPANWELSDVHMKTGEPRWTLTAENFSLYPKHESSSFLPGERTMLIALSDDKPPVALDIEQGEFLALTEVAAFPCSVISGASFMQRKYSAVWQDYVRYSAHRVGAACDADGTEFTSDPTEMSRGVIMGLQIEQFNQPSSGNDLFAERVRIINTKQGLTAFKF